MFNIFIVNLFRVILGKADKSSVSCQVKCRRLYAHRQRLHVMISGVNFNQLRRACPYSTHSHSLASCRRP